MSLDLGNKLGEKTVKNSVMLITFFQIQSIFHVDSMPSHCIFLLKLCGNNVDSTIFLPEMYGLCIHVYLYCRFGASDTVDRTESSKMYYLLYVHVISWSVSAPPIFQLPVAYGL